MNELQARIKDVTRKMMAMVSEVSMNQANALKLQQTLKEKEGELEQCYIRYGGYAKYGFSGITHVSGKIFRSFKQLSLERGCIVMDYIVNRQYKANNKVKQNQKCPKK